MSPAPCREHPSSTRIPQCLHWTEQPQKSQFILVVGKGFTLLSFPTTMPRQPCCRRRSKKVGITNAFRKQAKSVMNDVAVAVGIASAEVAYAVVDHDLLAEVQR